MIIKGRAVGSIAHWGRYLAEQGKNEKAIEHEIPGTALNLKHALEEMRDLALNTATEGNFLYHVSFNPKANEKLTPGQWLRAIDLVEERLGFTGHQRIVYEHIKEGRQHFHVLWNRADPVTFKIRDIGGDRYTLRRCANELEKELGLTPTKAVRSYDDPRPFQEWEQVRAGRSKIDPRQMTAELTRLWHSTDCGKAFIAALEDKGYAIAKGDRRDYVVLDAEGDVHSLARRLQGVRVADVRARFQDVDRDGIPSIAEARASQRERAMERDGMYDRDAAEQIWSEKFEAALAGREQQKDERRREAALHPIFDRDAQDREWQNNMADAAMRHAAENYPSAWEEAQREPRTPIEKFIAQNLADNKDPAAFLAAFREKNLIVARTTRRGIAQYEMDIEEHNAHRERVWQHASKENSALPRPKAFQARDLDPDQIVLVNRFGGVHTLSDKRVDVRALAQRTIKALGTIPALEAARAEQIKLLREPRSGMEKFIAESLAQFASPDEFAQALAGKELMVARATEEGIAQYQEDIRQKNLKSLKAWEQYLPANQNLPRPEAIRLPHLKPGQIVLVNRWGGVHTLNKHRVDLKELARRTEAGLGPVPTMQTARAEMRYFQELKMQEHRQRTAALDRGHGDMVSEQRAANRRFHGKHLGFRRRLAAKKLAGSNEKLMAKAEERLNRQLGFWTKRRQKEEAGQNGAVTPGIMTADREARAARRQDTQASQVQDQRQQQRDHTRPPDTGRDR